MGKENPELPRWGWTLHRDQSSDAALEAGAWNIRTVLSSGVVVLTRPSKGLVSLRKMFVTMCFETETAEKTGGQAHAQMSATVETAKNTHYAYVRHLVASGEVVSLV